jgi:hypothetical protein
MWLIGGHYEAWATFLERWGAGESLDPASLPPITTEDLAGDSWQRLVDRITAALSQRLRTWSDTLSREISGARDEFSAARALNHARWSLPPIRALAGAEALPAEFSTRLLALVDEQIRDSQRQLDEQTDRMRRSGLPHSAVEARLRTIRDNPLTALTAGAHVTDAGWAADPAARPRRRVIVD